MVPLRVSSDMEFTLLSQIISHSSKQRWFQEKIKCKESGDINTWKWGMLGDSANKRTLKMTVEKWIK